MRTDYITSAEKLVEILRDGKAVHLAVTHHVGTSFYNEVTAVDDDSVFAYVSTQVLVKVRTANLSGLRTMLVAQPECAPSWILASEDGPFADYEIAVSYTKRPDIPVVPHPDVPTNVPKAMHALALQISTYMRARPALLAKARESGLPYRTMIAESGLATHLTEGSMLWARLMDALVVLI